MGRLVLPVLNQLFLILLYFLKHERITFFFSLEIWNIGAKLEVANPAVVDILIQYSIHWAVETASARKLSSSRFAAQL